jgi:putative flippase GtrA
MIGAKTRRQLLRYGVVGLTSNLILYLAYLALTALGVGHKTAMTVLYVVAVTQTFFINRAWSFCHQGAPQGAFVRYITSYAIGYALNLSMLWLAVDVLSLPHQIVQGVMIIIVAATVFLLQKFWVFSDKTTRAEEVT